MWYVKVTVLFNQIFPILAVFQSLETAIGCDNHYLNLVHMISHKYLKLCIKKICRDKALQNSHGNSIIQSRVFKGLCKDLDLTFSSFCSGSQILNAQWFPGPWHWPWHWLPHLLHSVVPYAAWRKIKFLLKISRIEWKM